MENLKNLDKKKFNYFKLCSPNNRVGGEWFIALRKDRDIVAYLKLKALDLVANLCMIREYYNGKGKPYFNDLEMYGTDKVMRDWLVKVKEDDRDYVEFIRGLLTPIRILRFTKRSIFVDANDNVFSSTEKLPKHWRCIAALSKEGIVYPPKGSYDLLT